MTSLNASQVTKKHRSGLDRCFADVERMGRELDEEDEKNPLLSAAMLGLPKSQRQDVLTLAQSVMCESAVAILLKRISMELKHCAPSFALWRVEALDGCYLV